MENRVSEKKNTIIIITFLGIYAIVTLFLPRLSYFRHTPLSLWIQAINYMALGTTGLIAFRSMIKEGVNQWRIHTVTHLLWLTGAFAAYIILSNLSALPLAMLYPDYVSINDNSVAEAAAILPIPISFIAFGILGSVTEEFVFRIIPVKKGKRIPIVIRVILASLLFMILHMHELTLQELLYNLGMFVMGIIYSVVFIKTKNATIPLLMHLLNNAPALLLFLLQSA